MRFFCLLSISLASLVSCRTPAPPPEDQDGDGYGYVTDCNDEDPSIYPGSAIHEDPALCFLDRDGDGYGDPNAMTPYAVGSDCDDNDPTIHPGSLEYCDGIDQNCNGEIDEGIPYKTLYPDEDGDGFGSEDLAIWTCSDPENHVNRDGDCNDQDSLINPTATEICDGGIDNDCNGLSDDADPSVDPDGQTDWWLDSDNDGFGAMGEPIAACDAPLGHVSNSEDCLDSGEINGILASSIHPGAPELCDSVDNDCDGKVDDEDDFLALEGTPKFYGDLDGDGYGDFSNWVVACAQPDGWVNNHLDCLDAGTLSGVDASAINPDAIEICDSIDNDCDGKIDDDDNSLNLTTASSWYLDAAHDGYGDPNHVAYQCIQPQTHVANNTDCLDSGFLYGFPADAIHPGATEICDPHFVDNACDGPNDNGLISFENQHGQWSLIPHLNGYASTGSGSLHICEGEHFAQLDILHDIDIQSHGVVTLNGQGMGSVINVQTGSAVSISDVSITNGNGDLWGGEWIGGGINCAVHTGPSQAVLTLNNVDVFDNAADLGAGLYAENCHVSVSNSSIRDNALSAQGSGAAIYAKSSDLVSLNNAYRNNTGGLNVIEAIDSNATFTDDVIMSNDHEECTFALGEAGGYSPSVGVLTNVHVIDNDSDRGALWIREGSQVQADAVVFNGNSPFEVFTNDIDYYMGPVASFNCLEQTSGINTMLRCGTPITVEPEYTTHLDTHYASDTQFHSALFTIPANGSPTIDSFGIKSLDALILQCRTDFSIHHEENGEWTLIWEETVNQGNAIANQGPRVLRTSAIDLPFAGGETLLFGVVISNCIGVAFESPQPTNTYGSTLLWDPTAYIGPPSMNADRSFDAATLADGLGGPQISFKIHLTDEN